MEREKKPDLSGTVNGLDISIFKRESGVEISVEQEGREVVLFRYAPQGVQKEPETASLPPTPAMLPSAPLASAQSTAQETPSPQETAKTPMKIVGTIVEIEGLGQTPTTGDPVFRFSVRWSNPKINAEEVSQVAAFREIAQGLQQFYSSPDPDVKLQPGRRISMMAWDHTARTGSYYPSKVEYLNFQPLTYPPKTQKQR